MGKRSESESGDRQLHKDFVGLNCGLLWKLRRDALPLPVCPSKHNTHTNKKQNNNDIKATARLRLKKKKKNSLTVTAKQIVSV